MARAKDLSGQRFGKLVALEMFGRDSGVELDGDVNVIVESSQTLHRVI